MQAHLDDCDRCRLVMAEAVRSASEAASPTPGASTPFRNLQEGQRLVDRYEIRRFIARGGMGEVYEAFDSQLGERIALKTLLPTALDDERAVERLRGEVRLARKVTHRNVCRILEFGVFHQGGEPGPGIPFLTMEFLIGEPLSHRIATRGPMPLTVVGRLVSDVAAGLSAIHAAGIVHRDFKSENIFLVPDGDGERAVIMDFGLARGLDERRGSTTAAAGTPDYMAPEQVEGKPATPAFDVYALGVVIFEVLTARKPFGGSSPYMAALSRLQQPAPAPSEVVPGLPPAWDALVGRCLERRPERRFGRVEDVALAVEAALGEAPRPHRARTLAISGALGLAAVMGLLAWRPGARPPAISAAPAPVVVATAPPAVAPPAPVASSPPSSPAPVALAATPERPRPGANRSRAAAPRPALTTAAPAATATVAEAAPPPEAANVLQQAQALMLEGEVARACEQGQRAATLSPDLPAVQLFLGKCYIRLGDSARARRHYRRYLELAPDAPDRVFVRGIVDSAR